MRKFYTAGSANIAMRTNGVLTWVLSDHLGSASVTVDESGVELNETRYTAFGEVRHGFDSLETGYEYTAQLSQMEEIGLYYYVARWYDPVTAHFGSADSIIPEAGKNLAFDRYAYSNFNPVKFSDPSGHSAWDFIGQFATGLVYEFAMRNAWMSPQATDTLSVNSAESDAQIMGRVAGDLLTIAIGVVELNSGVGIGTLGTVAACIGTGCIGVIATVGAGAILAANGVITSINGGVGIGRNLSLLLKKDEDTLKPGPYARDSIQARGPDRNFTEDEKAAIDKIGQEQGCHTCGTKNPGTATGHFVPDHQPPSALNPANGKQRLFPQCINCSRRQGGQVLQFLRKHGSDIAR